MSAMNDMRSLLVSVGRLGRGWYVLDRASEPPPKLLELYEFEA